jgi:hypothetical protein
MTTSSFSSPTACDEDSVPIVSFHSNLRKRMMTMDAFPQASLSTRPEASATVPTDARHCTDLPETQPQSPSSKMDCNGASVSCELLYHSPESTRPLEDGRVLVDDPEVPTSAPPTAITNSTSPSFKAREWPPDRLSLPSASYRTGKDEEVSSSSPVTSFPSTSATTSVCMLLRRTPGGMK